MCYCSDSLSLLDGTSDHQCKHHSSSKTRSGMPLTICDAAWLIAHPTLHERTFRLKWVLCALLCMFCWSREHMHARGAMRRPRRLQALLLQHSQLNPSRHTNIHPMSYTTVVCLSTRVLSQIIPRLYTRACAVCWSCEHMHAGGDVGCPRRRAGAAAAADAAA
jgi:hypothetical protein